MTDAPSPFSASLPALQTAWDATSMRALQFCPRYYEYTILQGWRGSSLDLEFGILFHEAVEVYDRMRLRGCDKAEAQYYAVTHALRSSGSYEGEPLVWHPWGGEYAELWHCKGTEPYSVGGRKRKCPHSLVKAWQSGERPPYCGECGSETETAIHYLPHDNAKNRHTLVRLVAWYCEEQPEDGGMQPYAFPNGEAAVEIPFRMALPWQSPDGEPYILCGYLDGITQFGDEFFVRERKTTTRTLGKSYFAGFSPSVQIDTYDIAGSALFPDLNLRGVLLDAAQTMVNGARFGCRPLHRNEAQREEFMRELHWWIGQAEAFAKAGYWPMNRANCWLCAFKHICSKPADTREMYLRADFERKPWNPLEER